MGLGRQLHEAGAEVHYRYCNDLKVTAAFTGKRTTTPVGFIPFPNDYVASSVRNPKSVLILDDYKPDKRPVVAQAIEAGAQYSGLVIITSNYEDPFKLTEPSLEVISESQAFASKLLEETSPEIHAANQKARLQHEDELSASLRSRIAAGFKFIEFTGPDHRAENNFWD